MYSPLTLKFICHHQEQHSSGSRPHSVNVDHGWRALGVDMWCSSKAVSPFVRMRKIQLLPLNYQGVSPCLHMRMRTHKIRLLHVVIWCIKPCVNGGTVQHPMALRMLWRHPLRMCIRIRIRIQIWIWIRIRICIQTKGDTALWTRRESLQLLPGPHLIRKLSFILASYIQHLLYFLPVCFYLVIAVSTI